MMRSPVFLAVPATLTAASLSILAGWQRGGWLPERLLWVAIGVVLVVGAHLLPALCRTRGLTIRCIGGALWICCMGATCLGHCLFFLLAQQHAGEVRADALSVPHSVVTIGRSPTQIAEDRASTVADLTARCSSDCVSKRATLRARLDALDVEMGEARRQEAQADRTTALQDRAEDRRDAMRADPVTSRVAALVGVPVTRVDLLTGLAFAAVLEGVACFCWLLTFDTATEHGIRFRDTPAPISTVGYSTPAEPVTPTVTVRDEPSDDLTHVREAIAAGRLRGTVAEIRKHLGCSQSRAMAVRRQLATGAEIA